MRKGHYLENECWRINVFMHHHSSTKAETGSMHRVCPSIYIYMYSEFYIRQCTEELLCSLMFLLCIPLYDSMLFFQRKVWYLLTVICYFTFLLNEIWYNALHTYMEAVSIPYNVNFLSWVNVTPLYLCLFRRVPFFMHISLCSILTYTIAAATRGVSSSCRIWI
jgi:hypothetical protein